MTEFDIGIVLAAWLTGFAGGSGHCLGMCGGIVGALGVGQGAGWRGLVRIAAAHLGRITSYAVAGAIVAAAGSAVVSILPGADSRLLLRTAAAMLILAIGLKLLLGWPRLRGIELGGAGAWRLLAPQLRRLLPPRDPLRAFGVGALWGWLPCGLVYAQLTVATAAGSARTGALVMAAFGLGTIVSLSLVGVLLHSLGLARLPRRASGALLVLFAVWTVLPLLTTAGPHAH
jgi:sulfite exporter TauE/SafE